MIRQRILIAMVAILLLAAALRFFRLDSQSFWHDEGNSARLSERSIDLIIEGAASDIHPPLYYLILHGWRQLVGDSEFALRSFSVFLGIGLAAMTYSLGRQLVGPAGRVAAIAGALLAAVNPALVYYSQEARMYEMLAFLAVLSTLLLVKLLQRSGWPLGLATAYILVVVAGLYTHYFFPAVLVTHNLIFLGWFVWWYRVRQRNVKKDVEKQKSADEEIGNLGTALDSDSKSARTKKARLPLIPWSDLGAWVLIMLAVIALYLPWVPVFVRQAGSRSGSDLSILSFLLESSKWLTFGPTVELAEVRFALIAYAILFLLGLFLGRKTIQYGVSLDITLFFSVIIPLMVMWFTGAIRPAFYKFMLVSVAPLCLLTGSGAMSTWELPTSPNRRWLLRSIVAVLALLVFWGTIRSLNNMYFEPRYARADYRAMAKQIEAEDHPNAAVILNAANQWEVFTYYHKKGAPVFPVPAGYPDPVEIESELSNIADHFDRVYAIFWGEAERDPQRLVERWLDDHAFKARDEWIGDVRLVTYAVPTGDLEAMDTSTDVQFGDAISLLGYSLQSDEVISGDILQLTLFWQTSEQLDGRYKIFLHLVDEQGKIFAQRDSEPDGNLAPTTIWLPGETVVDNHGLFIPKETLSGTYTLNLGLYDFADPANRLPIDLGDNGLDTWSVARITVSGE